MATELIRTVVTGPVETPLGDKPLQGRIRLTLTGFDGQGGTVVTPVTLEATLDSEGQFSLQPWCPAEGDYTLSYDVEIGWWSEATNAFVWKHWGYIAPIYAAAPQPILALRTTTPPAPLPVDLLAAINAAVSASAVSAALATSAAATATAAAASINSRAVDNTAALKALDTTVWRAAFIRAGLNAGVYFWQSGNFSVQHAAEAGADYFLIKADAIAVTAGAWARFAIAHDPADFHDFKAHDGALNFRVEALETATAWWAAMGGTAPFGPTLYADGAATDISAQIVSKGSGGLVIGNALGRMLEVLAGVAGYVADRIIKIRPGLTGTSYASIDAEAGLDLKAGGDTILRLLDGAGAGTAHLEVAADGTGYVVIRPSSGDALVLAGDAGGLQVQGATLMARKTTVYSVATGGTVSPSAYDGDSVISPIGAPLASLTIRLPASPPDGAEVRVSSRGSVSSLTWTSLSGVPDPILSPPSSIGATTPVTLKFSTGYGWYKVA